jgi:MFS family permease
MAAPGRSAAGWLNCLSLGSQQFPIRRNTALLGAANAVNSAVLQLVAAVSSLTFVLVTGFEGLLGLGPAIFMGASALTALPAGRAMDRFGRVPVIAAGFALGATGCLVTAAATRIESAALVVGGIALVGASGAIALLVRTAAGDMYPPERRARGIAWVLFGAVFGAILGPAVFSPLLAGRDLGGDTLAVLWLAAGGFELVGLGLVTAVRPDPKQIATLLGHQPPDVSERAAPTGELLRRPGVVGALVAAQASLGVMVAVMTLTGAMVVDHFQHEHHAVFPIIGAHFVGMYALVLVVGDLVDRIGRTRSLTWGLLGMGLSVSALLWVESVHATAAALFGLGLGWNVSFVASTAVLADRTKPSERGSLLGFNDLLSGATGAGLTLLGGFILTAAGVAAVVIGAVVLLVAPAVWILRDGAAPRSAGSHATAPRRRS